MKNALPPLRMTGALPEARDLATWVLRGRETFEAERRRLERAYAELNGGAEALLVGSGRRGFQLVLEALQSAHRDAVVLPAYADLSLVQTVRRIGLEPVACDVRASDGTLDPTDFERVL